MRLYLLAKELGIETKTLMKKAQNIGIAVNNHMKNLTDEQVIQLKQAVGVMPVAPAPTASEHAKERQRRRRRRGRGEKPEGAGVSTAPAAAEPARPAPQRRPMEAPRTPESVVGQAPSTPAGVKVAPEPLRKRGLGPETIVTATSREPAWMLLTPEERFRRHKSKRRPQAETPPPPTQKKGEKVTIEPPITVKSLSAALGIKASEIIANLMRQGILATVNQVISPELAGLIAAEQDIELEVRKPQPIEQKLTVEASRPEDLKPRAPIVTFMGHVDHGKTSLLDRIRETNVASQEAGGITQHIGAYRVDVGGRSVVFLDTPGHEAFTAMRARGANVTDVVVLVVAADDGVMPQTEEAIDHARAAGVPIVVALNKIDKPTANPNRVKQQLAALGLQPEEWGGDTVFVEVSALTGQGVDELVEMLALVAEMRDLKANPNRPACGTVLESRVHETRGVTTTLLVQDGTLHRGDIMICGSTYGRVKALFNHLGHPIREAGPATPVEVLGLSEPPEAGDTFMVVQDPQKAKEIAAQRKEQRRIEALTVRRHVTLENLYESLTTSAEKELRLILKADVKGSLEALQGILRDLSTDEVKIRVLRSGIGGVNLSDVLLADASDAVIVGLHVTAENEARILAEQKHVDIRLYNIIYRVQEDIKAALEGMLEPEEREVITGHAEVRQVFRLSRGITVAGCYVKDGVFTRGQPVRLSRDQIVIHEGRIESIRRLKDDVREVREGFECGIRLAGYDDVKEGDIIEGYRVEKIARKLEQVATQQTTPKTE